MVGLYQEKLVERKSENWREKGDSRESSGVLECNSETREKGKDTGGGRRFFLATAANNSRFTSFPVLLLPALHLLTAPLPQSNSAS